MENLFQMSAREIGQHIQKRELRIGDVAFAYLNQIQKLDPDLHAFLAINENHIEEQIRKVESGIDQGRYTGPLAGVPVAVKDNICTKGLATTCASKMLEHFIPCYDAEVVSRMKAAGMIVLGKTNMDEFAMGSTSETSYFQVTSNPWKKGHVPGGSSGGSCAAVAAGEAPLALGSDTGGSIRQPASYCGVCGLKPTYGRVSRWGLIAYASSLDQIGPIGKTAGDCAALFEVIAGNDPKDSTSSNRPLEPAQELISGGLTGMRIGIPEELLAEGVDEDVRTAILNGAELMREHGAQVESFSLGMTDYLIPAYYIIACAEASSNLERFDGVKYGYRSPEAVELHEMYRKSRQEGFGPEVKRRILLGSFVLSSGYYDAYYMKALRAKALILDAFNKAFEQYDCILAPAAPSTAPKIGSSLSDPLKMYLSDVDTVAVNLCGLPGISVPCGIDSQGLPVGMQIIGNHFQEKKILQTAATYEALRGVFPTAQTLGAEQE